MTNSSESQALSLRGLGRLLLVGAAGTVIALVLTIAAGGIASAFPGHGLGFVTGPAAAALFVWAIVFLLRATEPASEREARQPALIAWDDPVLFPAVLAELRAASSKAKTPGAALLLLSVLAFLSSGAAYRSTSTAALLVVVLLVHELGHLAAMRVFGYRDLNVFFIPLVGAMATGRKDGASAWQQVTVSLMGPAPGLLVGFGVAAFGGSWVGLPFVQQAIGLSLFVNAVNLLPFEPLDGGRIATVLLFANHPRTRVLFGAATAVALAALALQFGAPALAAVAALILVSSASRFRVAACAARLRARHASRPTGLPGAIAHAPEAWAYQLFLEWRSASQSSGKPANPRAVAQALRAVHEATVAASARGATRLALGFTYLALLVPAVFVIAKL